MWNFNSIVQQMRFERRKGSEGGSLRNSFLLLALGSSVGIDTVHFDDRGTLGQVGRHDHLADNVNGDLKKDGLTYRDCHQLLDILDLVTRGGRPPTFEHGFDLGSREQALLGCLRLFNNLAVSTKHNLVFLSIILIEKSLLVVQGA